jgi:CRP-like cAMP-binding protein
MPHGPHNLIDKAAILGRTELFAKLPEAAIAELANYAVIRRLWPDEILFSENQEPAALYVVASGSFRAVRRDVHGREQVLSTEEAGAVLGMAAIFDNGQYYTTTMADTASEVLCLHKSDIDAFCRAHVEIYPVVSRLLARKLRQYADLIQALALLNVEQRVALYLANRCEGTVAPGASGHDIELNITQGELATRIGSTREVVNRALHRLQQRGLVELKGVRFVAVPSIEALTAFAGMQSDVAAGELANKRVALRVFETDPEPERREASDTLSAERWAEHNTHRANRDRSR